MMTPRTSDPQTQSQQRIFMILPLFSLFYGWFLPAGLFIYWIVFTAYSIVQQYLIVGWGSLFPLFGWTPGFARDHQPRFPVTSRRRSSKPDTAADGRSTTDSRSPEDRAAAQSGRTASAGGPAAEGDGDERIPGVHRQDSRGGTARARDAFGAAASTSSISRSSPRAAAACSAWARSPRGSLPRRVRRWAAPLRGARPRPRRRCLPPPPRESFGDRADRPDRGDRDRRRGARAASAATAAAAPDRGPRREGGYSSESCRPPERPPASARG